MQKKSIGSPTRVIPSLDGARALAVAAVILFHCKALDGIRWLAPVRNGELGVTCFFVISGLLITRLLLDELDGGERIDLVRFYLRRSFRIFPAFYAYLLVVGVVGLFHLTPLGMKSFLTAAFYVKNYAPHPLAPLLEHTWSLSLEEQFYLLWPACLFFFSPRTCLRIAAFAIVFSPLLRVLTYVLVPSMRDHINFMLHTRLDAIMVGAFLSISQHQRVFASLRSSLAKPVWLLPVSVYFLLIPTLEARFRGAYSLTLGYSLDAFACAAILLYAINSPHSWLGRLLNLRWLRHLGVISYSLYLWQQFFTFGPVSIPFPLNLVLILIAAETSYWLVERTFLKLRNRVVPQRVRLADPIIRENAIEQLH